MVKRIICFLLVLSIFSSQLSKLSIYVNFKLNQDFIAEVLCINKDKPMSNCNGQCYLTKQIKAQEEKNETQTPKKINERAEVLFCDAYQVSYCVSNIEFLEEAVILPKNLDFNIQEFIEDIFHPPQIA